MSSIRKQLRDKVEARLRQIRAGGQVTIAHTGRQHVFVTDIGRDIIPWRIGDVLPNEMPCAGFADTVAPAGLTETEAGQQTHGLAVEIVGLVSGADHVGQATAALLDILAAVGVDPEWDHLGDAWTTLEETEIEIHPDGREIAAAIVKIRVDYFTPIWEA
jgi:hypothetical protein